ncbi:hypothetical protein HDZ31DRAFT_64176 [Schizophyllum fasciatum]
MPTTYKSRLRQSQFHRPPTKQLWIVSHDKHKRRCDLLVDHGQKPAQCVQRPGRRCVAHELRPVHLVEKAPSVRYVATYDSRFVAEDRAAELSGGTLCGSRVTTRWRKPRSASAAPSNDVVIAGIPPSAAARDVAHFAKTSGVVKEHTKNYDINEALCELKNIIRKIFGLSEVNLEVVSRPKDTMMKVCLRFKDEIRAERVRNALDGKAYSWNGNSPLCASLDEPVQYKLSIPNPQYEAQREQWWALAADSADGRDCSPPLDTVYYMNPSAPFRLDCGHVYRTACAKHLLSSATENKSFPLICIGDEAACAVPIPIPTIRKFLIDEAMGRLFDAAFAAHVERNPD